MGKWQGGLLYRDGIVHGVERGDVLIDVSRWSTNRALPPMNNE